MATNDDTILNDQLPGNNDQMDVQAEPDAGNAAQQPQQPMTDMNALANWMLQATNILQTLSNNQNPGNPTRPNVTLPNFHGKNDENVTVFLYQLGQIFDARGIPADARIGYAIGALRGNALIWCQNQWSQHVEWHTYREFADALTAAFELPNYQVLLRKKLALLKQTRDLQTYIFQFRNLIGQLIEMADLDQVQYFQAGLKPVTRMEVNYRNPQDLEAAIRIAIEFDASRFGAQRPLMTQTNPTRSFQHNHDDGGVRPMELDNINHRTRLSEAEKAKLIKEGKCFKCRKQGHRASRCPERTNHQTAAAVGTPRAEEGPTLNQVQPTKKTREQLIRVEGMIAGNPATILIDSGASRNYIDQKFTKEHEIPVKPGTASPTIELADGTLSKCAGQTNGLTIEFQAHTTKEQQFDVLPLGQNNAILGKPWLWDTNPTINWRTNEVTVKGTTLRSLSQDFEEAATLNMARKNKRKSKGKSATPAPPVYGRNAVIRFRIKDSWSTRTTSTRSAHGPHPRTFTSSDSSLWPRTTASSSRISRNPPAP